MGGGGVSRKEVKLVRDEIRVLMDAGVVLLRVKPSISRYNFTKTKKLEDKRKILGGILLVELISRGDY